MQTAPAKQLSKTLLFLSTSIGIMGSVANLDSIKTKIPRKTNDRSIGIILITAAARLDSNRKTDIVYND